MRRLQWVPRLLLALLLIPPVLGLLVFGALQTGFGQRQAVSWIEALASGPDLDLSIGELDGGLLPFDVTIREVVLADGDGPWATIDRAHLTWSPGALWNGVLQVDALTAGRIALDRLPRAGEATPAPAPAEPLDPTAIRLPELPLGLRLDQLSAEEIVLGAAVLGNPARLTVDGTARLVDPADGLRVALTVIRTDEMPSRMALTAAFVPHDGRLTVALDASEPPGGLLATLIGLPGEPAVDITLQGDGPLADWVADLRIDAGAGFTGTADIRVERTDDGHALAALSNLDPSALLPPEIAPMVTGGLTLDAQLHVGDDGAVHIAQVEASTAAGTVQLSGGLGPGLPTFDLSLGGVAGDPTAFAAILPATAWRELAATGSLSGTPAAPSLTLDIAASGLAAAGFAAERLALSVAAAANGDLSDPEAALAVTVRADAADLAADGSLLSPSVDLTVDGQFGLDGRIALDRAVLELPAFRLTASGQAARWGDAAELSATIAVPDLAVVADPAGVPLTGALSLEITAVRDAGTTEIDATADIVALQSGIAAVDGLLGEQATLALNAAFQDDGAVRVPVLSLDAAGLTLAGENLHLTADAAGGAIALTIPALTALDPTWAGTATLTANLSGTLAAPTIGAVVTAADVAVAGIAGPAARLRATAVNLADRPHGDLELVGDIAGLPAALSLQFSVQDQAVAIGDLEADIAGARLDGMLTAGFDGLVTGTVSASVADLAAFSVLAGQPLSGAAAVEIDLAADAGQDVTASLQIDNLALADTATVAAASLQASLGDALGTPQIQATLTATGVSASGVALDQARATVNGGSDMLALALDVSGQELALDAAATLVQAGTTTRIGLTGLTADYRGETIALARPAAVEILPVGLVVNGLVLAAREGTIALDGRYDPADLDLALAISDLPLSLVDLVAPGLDATGTINGSAALNGGLAAASGRFELAVADAGLADLRALGLPAIDVTATGDWNGARLALQGAVRSNRIGDVSLAGALPLTMDPAGVPTVPENGALAATLDGRVDLAAFNTLLAATGSQITGTATLDLQVGGTIGDPRPLGTVRLADASFADPVNGVSLTDITATLAGDGEAFRLTDLSGATPGGGTLSGAGTLTLDPDAEQAIDLSLSLNDADLIASELLTGTFDADLTMQGTFLEALLAGSVSVEHAVLRIPNSLPASVPTLDVELVNAPPEIADRFGQDPDPQDQPRETAAFDLQLDIAVSAPQEVYVRGRGLNAEVGGEIRATGAATSPRLDGALALRRGDLDLLGHRFTFDRGRVNFLGGAAIDPELDFLAMTQADGLVILVGVAGRTSAPSFALSSQPEVPEDEILSRLLFGRSSSQLSAIQAIQLAQSAATLAGLGGSEGLLGSVRDVLGVDRLEITDGSGGGGMAVQAGRYVGDGIYVGVEQGLEQGASEVVVEVEITDNITVETDVGSDATGRVGVNFQWDY